MGAEKPRGRVAAARPQSHEQVCARANLTTWGPAVLYRPPTAGIERHALDIAAEFERKVGPFRAEIVPDATPAWHIVRTTPGAEDKAARFLEARAIGVFLPRFVKGSQMMLHGERIDLSERLIFSCLVFVFVWDILRHWGRIKVCPGVQSIMCDVSDRPVVVPDDQLNRIQVLQYKLAISRSKRRKRYRSAEDRITLSTVSHWR